MISFSEIAELITAGAAVGAVVMGVRNGHKIQEVKITIDGRMEQLLAVTKMEAHAAGMKQEKDSEK